MGKKKEIRKNLEALDSGSYRLTKQINGKRIRFVFDHYPSEAEVQIAIANKLQVSVEDIPQYRSTLKVCAENYISAKEAVLSVTTIREYRRLSNCISPTLLKLPLSKISQMDIQKEVSRYSKTHSAKSTQNFAGFICAVCKMHDKPIRVTLPQVEHTEKYIPDRGEVKQVIEALQGTRYYVPFMLSLCGLRRSEIGGLRAEDIELIDDNTAVAHIQRVKVQKAKHQWVIKETPKTAKSNRFVNIPVDVAKMIIENGEAYSGYLGTISIYLNEVQDRLQIPRFSIHACRHYFATELARQGVSEADIMALGGWSTPSVMKKVYTHSRMKDDIKARQSAIDTLMNNLQ